MQRLSIPNPWQGLPTEPDFVLQCDAEQIRAFNRHAAPRFRFDLTLYPEPYFGAREAPVLALTLNPGWDAADAAVHGEPTFRTQARASLRHELTPYPHLHLQPHGQSPGARWWHARTEVVLGGA
jgi:hypothetical protein